ncbi:MAG TPA: type II secretion system F family protein [Candidatus Tectomicrobia bacterium]|nr:type II secretion system F family protein [Candidatus Tectomicrobia bacterium]
MDTPLLIAIFVAIIVLLIFLALSSYLQRRQQIAGWMRRVWGKEEENESDASQEAFPSTKSHVYDALGALGGTIQPRNEAELSHVRRTLVKAGYRGSQAPLVFFGARLSLAVLLAVIFPMVRLFAVPTLTSSWTMLLIVLSALVGFYLPNLWVRLKIASRKRQVFEGFPDALDLMVVCVEAGLGLDAAINRVAEEMKFSHPMLSEEFRLVNWELRAGQAREQALRNLGLRTDLEDVTSLTTLLIQTDKFGTSVAQALRVQSEAMRVKRHQRAEELAAKLPVKLLFPLILFIFPSLFVVIIGPAVIQIARVLLPGLGGQ